MSQLPRSMQMSLQLLATFLRDKEEQPREDYRDAYYQLRGGLRQLSDRIERGERLELRELVNLSGAALVVLREQMTAEAGGRLVPNADHPVAEIPKACTCIYANGQRVRGGGARRCPRHSVKNA